VSIVTRILALMAATLLLVAGGEVFNGFNLRAKRFAELGGETGQLAHMAALDMSRILEGAHQLLETLAVLPGSHGWDDRACAILKATAKRASEYDHIVAVDRDGTLQCREAGSRRVGLSVSDRSLLDRVLANDNFTVGSYGVSSVSGNPVLRVGYPVVDETDRVVGVVYAGISVAWLNAAIDQWQLGEIATISIVDRNGTLIAGDPGVLGGEGKPIPESFRSLLSAADVGTVEASGSDGVARLFGYVPVGVGPSKGIAVLVGRRYDTAVADINNSILLNVAVILGALVLAAIGALIYVRRILERPFMNLLAVAGRWRGGDWSARTGVAAGIPEFDRLASAFDGMAAEVSERDRGLTYRDAISRAVAECAAELVTADTMAEATPRILKTIGETIRVDRIFALETPAAGAPLKLRHIWHGPSAPAELDQELFDSWPSEELPEFTEWLRPLREGRISATLRRDRQGAVADLFDRFKVVSNLQAPIRVDGRPWGVLALDDCFAERAWSPTETDAARVLADLIGAAITRERHIEELSNADEVVRSSPAIVYRMAIDGDRPRLTYISENVSLLGISAQEVMGDPARSIAIIHPDDRVAVQASLGSTMASAPAGAPDAGGDVQAGLLPFRVADGSGAYRWVENRYKLTRDDSGRLVELAGVLIDVTDRKHAEVTLKRERDFSAAVIDDLPGLFFVLDSKGRIVRSNAGMSLATGKSSAELKGNSALTSVAEPDRVYAVSKFREALEQGHAEGEIGVSDSDGTPHPYFLTAAKIDLEDGPGFLGIGMNVSEARRNEKLLRESEQRFRAIFKSVSDGIFVYEVKTGVRVEANQTACDMFGYSREEILKCDFGSLSSGVEPYTPEAARKRFDAARSGALQSFEWQAKAKDGRPFFTEMTLHKVDFGDREYILSNVHDISERKATDQKILQMARFDNLTGLANRAVFAEAVHQAIAATRHDSKGFAVLYLDVDHFKDVNDTLGHPTGDALLWLVAERLRGAVRAQDTVARFGGDEFAVLQADLEEPTDAGLLADRLLASLSQPYIIGSNEIRSGASIGVAIYGPDATDAEALLSRADMALYRAKAEGRGTYRFFTDAMDIEVRRRVDLGNDLRTAVEADELFLEYQPQVDAETGRISGVEALLRWRHPRRGIVSPGEFIPVAERNGLIGVLGHFALREACRQARTWREAGIPPVKMAVNVSALQFKTPLALENDIRQALADFDMPAEQLELELTESALMDTSRRHNDVLEHLRALGLRLAIDDFGTGYSSLDYLRRFPVDRIKIAQNFIIDLGVTPGNAVIVRAAIGLARELGIAVLAEGVETEAQLRLLRQWGCSAVQGYYFSQPLSAAAVEPLLRRGHIFPSLRLVS
jgi:diguanylate cyclase (GGDEF)-like protein/PAS domain S-box-containing protein